MAGKSTIALAGLMLGAFAIGTDFTGVLLLVPQIESDFSADITTTQWVLNIYALTFAMFMVSGGRLGDLRGHRRMMLLGFVVFIGASFGCYLAPSITWLIIARALQGVGAALIWPCLIAKGSLAISGDRALGLGLVLAGVTTGNVIGPLISGVVVSFEDWRIFFLINTVIGLISLISAALLLDREHPHDVDESIDYGGIVLFSGSVLCLMLALDQGTSWGWAAPPTLALFGASAFLLLLFPFWETKARDPLVPLGMLRRREFVIALCANGFCVPAIFIAFLYLPQYMTKTLYWTTLQASYGMTPLMVLLAIGSVLCGALYKDFGPRRMLLAGYLLLLLGCLVIIFMDVSWRYEIVLPALFLLGLGGTLSVTSSGTAAVSAVDEAQSGLAGGLSFMLHLTSGAIGVAAATAVMYVTSAARLAKELTAAGINLSAADQRVINGSDPQTPEVEKILSTLGSEQSSQVATILTDAFAHGLKTSFWVAVVPLAIGLILIATLDESKLHGQ
ncbi:MAG: MFS transporter [Pseudomonadota bacterium]